MRSGQVSGAQNRGENNEWQKRMVKHYALPVSQFVHDVTSLDFKLSRCELSLLAGRWAARPRSRACVLHGGVEDWVLSLKSMPEAGIMLVWDVSRENQ